MDTATTLREALAAAHFDDSGFVRLFARLRAVFQSRGCLDPENLAAEAILRAMRRLITGVRVECFDAYSCGFASNIAREDWKMRRDAALPGDPAGPEPRFLGLNIREQAVLMEQCLNALRREDRVLLRAYYSADRDKLAIEHSCSPNALRIRVFRALAVVRKSIAKPGGECANSLPVQTT